MRRGKTALLLLACSICTAALMVLWPAQPVLSVETAVIGSGDLVQTKLLSGVVQYAQQPCISLKNGIVQQVYVSEGQQVKNGQLLFSLDTSAEEQALASLYAQRHAQQQTLAGMDDITAVLAVQSQLDLTANEMQLLASIEASNVRAAVDGIVQAVYVQPGDMTTETALLGVIRGTELEIVASAFESDARGVASGTAAIANVGLQTSVPLVLNSVQLTDTIDTQLLSFQPLEETTELKVGDTIEMELITEVYPDCALIPLSAVNVNNEVWLIEDGRAYKASVETDLYNRCYAATTMEWVGRNVILYPERYELQEGMPVKRAGTM